MDKDIDILSFLHVDFCLEKILARRTGKLGNRKIRSFDVFEFFNLLIVSWYLEIKITKRKSVNCFRLEMCKHFL